MTTTDDREALAKRLRHHAYVLSSDLDDPWTARDIEAAAELVATQPTASEPTVEQVEAAALGLYAYENCDMSENVGDLWATKASSWGRDEYRNLARAALEAAAKVGGE